MLTAAFVLLRGIIISASRGYYQGHHAISWEDWSSLIRARRSQETDVGRAPSVVARDSENKGLDLVRPPDGRRFSGQ